jgi:DNA repair protein RadD
MIQLRDYQEEAVQAHFRYFDSHSEGNPLFVIPTGGGKSLVSAWFIKTVVQAYPDERILLLTHVKELIEQNYAQLLRIWPDAPAGIYSAGLKSKELDRPITFAGIQSFHRVAHKIPPPSLVLIDEAHLFGKEDDTMYRKTINALTAANPDLRIIGYTATPYRLSGGMLHTGEGRIFTHIAYDLPVKRLIAEKYLCRPVVKHVERIIDTTGIASRGGDFVQGDLAKRVEQSLEAVEASVDEAVKISREQNRKHWLIFACSIAHAEMIYGKLNGLGVHARFVHGGTPSEDRAEFVRQAKAGEITALINVGVFTTGFDWPACDALWLMRPTQSTGLFIQMMGRGLRIAPGKDSGCLVLDYGENIERHGPIDAVSPKNAGDPKRLKTCPECASDVAVKLETCPDCGADLRRKMCRTCRATMPIAEIVCPECESDPASEPPRTQLENVARVTREASTAEALSSGKTPPKPPPEWLDVEDCSLYVWKKPGSQDSVRVRYSCGYREISEWVCPAHGGYATTKFRKWWTKMGADMPFPVTAEDTVRRCGEVRMPSRILVARDGKYDRVTEYDMTPRANFTIADEDLPF